MKSLPFLLMLSLTAPVFLTNADSNTYDTDKRISKEILTMESEGSEQLEILNKFNMLSVSKQQSLVAYLIIQNKYEALDYLLDSVFDINALYKGIPLLQLAVSQEHIETIKVLINKGADLELKGKINNSALLVSLGYKNLEVIKLLVEKGANLNARDKSNDTVLTRAVRSGDIDVIEYLIKAYGDITTLEENRSVVIAALVEKDKRVLELLLKHGIKIPDDALHRAIESKQIDKIKLLVEAGSDLEFRDSSEETALKSAVRTGKIEILEYLISKGANVNAKGKSDTTPLTTAVYEGNKDIVKLLVENGADIQHTKGDSDWNLLHFAADYNHVHLIDYLIENKINVNSRTRSGWSALSLASDEGHLEIVEKLLFHKADVELPTIKSKTTPIMAAAASGHTKVLNRLIEAGADYQRKNTKAHDPLWIAANKSHTETVKALLSVVKNPNQTFFDATTKGKFEVVRTLIKSGVDIHARTKKGSTAMHLAARFGHLDIVKLLQKNGVDIHAIATNKKDTPLMRAAGWGKRNVLNYLIDQGAEVDIQNKNGWTAALSTARHHRLDTLKLLIKNGANIRKTTNKGWTILMVAAKGKKRKTIEYLLKQDLDLDLKNNNGLTALDIAIKSKDEKIIEMLRKARADKTVITST